MARMIKNNERHIRYYAELSDEFLMDCRMVKHHIIFVGDKKGIRRSFNFVTKNINRFYSGPNLEKRLEGKVKNSDLNFLFVTIETPGNHEVLGLEKLRVPLKEDSELYERKHTKIEDYVKRIYEGGF